MFVDLNCFLRLAMWPMNLLLLIPKELYTILQHIFNHRLHDEIQKLKEENAKLKRTSSDDGSV